MVGAALPEATAEPFDVADPFFLVGKVHFPYEGAVTEDPHDSNNRHCRGNKHAPGGSRAGVVLKTSSPDKKQKNKKCLIK